jgi:hypothetical protein
MAEKSGLAPAHCGWFRQADAAVSLMTNESACLSDASSVLYAYHQDDPCVPPDCWRVSVRVAPAIPDHIVRECQQVGTVRETGPVLSAHVLTRRKRTLAWVPDNESLICADEGPKTVDVQCTAMEAALHWTTRLIRQVITAELVRRRAVYAHGAALLLRGQGVLILGPRGAGKTTTLLATLHHVGGAYVSNDRLLIYRHAGRVQALPWPTHLRAGTGTLAALPELTAELLQTEWRPTDESLTGNAKTVIPPACFGSLGRERTTARSCSPAVLIWPELRLADRPSSAELMRPGDVLTTLTRTRMFMTDPSTGAQSRINHWLIGLPSAVSADASLHAAAEMLASRVPCYRLRVGYDTKALAQCVDSIIPQRQAQGTGQ